MASLSAGDTVGRYVIQGVLGEGGMGRVYAALDPALQRSVALKVLAVRSVESESATQGAARLLREARAAATLEHVHIVAVYDVGEFDGTPFIVMELVRGRPLRSFIGDASVPLESRLRWLLGIARALAAAHGHGMVHRDVKPSNVMVRDDGVVKVLDFGVARRSPSRAPGAPATEDPELQTITAVGTVVGTPKYMAPEQFQLKAVDERADQFAWGVVAYELLVGRSPWRVAEPELPLAAAVMLQPVEAFAEQVPGLSPDVERIVLKALEKLPAARFASMGELVAGLEAIVADSASSRAAWPPSASASRRLQPDPNPTGASSLTTRMETPERTAGRRRSRRPIGVGVALLAALGLGGVAFVMNRSPVVAPAPSAMPPAAPKLTTLTDLPVPNAATPEALAAYRKGMQALRDGNGAAFDHFGRAVELDPSMAAAHLRLAIQLIVNSPTLARDHFTQALHSRSALSEHDQTLLDAMEPYIARDPADMPEAQRRTRAALDRFPDDEDFSLRLTSMSDGYALPEEQAARLDRLIALDPKFGFAYYLRALFQAYTDDFAGAIRTADKCLHEVPSADMCLGLRMDVERQAGWCEALEGDARRMSAIAPEDGFLPLAEALASEHRPLPTLREAVAQYDARIASYVPRGGGAPGQEQTASLALDVLSGDLASAEGRARAHVLALDSEPQRAPHAAATRLLAEIYLEEGKSSLAADAALDYLRRKDAWIPDARGEDFAIARDPTPYMAAVAMHAGKMTAGEFDGLRDHWMASWMAMVRPRYSPFVWMHGYAATVQSPAEAEAALAARGPDDRIPHFWVQTFLGGDVGRTLLLAGRLDDAIRELRASALACLVLDFPIESTRVNYWLGLALEQKGNSGAACAFYGSVLGTWGHAKPASVTAALAKGRAKALGCK
jgi:serine/threonine protein kinase/tetratricopeptide (TPR) repeat protein